MKKINFQNLPAKYFIAIDLVLIAAIVVIFFNLYKVPNLPQITPVVQASTEAHNIQQQCLQQDKQACFKKLLMADTKTYGLSEGEKILFALQDLDDNAKNCHVLAHFMSREAYNRNPKDFDNLVNTLDVNACGSGFLHGVLEAYTGDHPEIPIDGSFAQTICTRGNDSYRTRMCIHFMGHIFILNTEGNLAESINLCEDLKPEWQFDCYDGAFMEDHQKLALAEHEITPLPQLTPEYFNQMEKACLKFSGQQGNACWLEMAEMYAHAYGYNPDIIYNRCYKAPNPEYARSCYFKGVVVMAIYNGFETKDKLLSLCSFYTSNPGLYGACTKNIIFALMYYSPKYTSRGITLCSNVEQSYTDSCFRELGTQLKIVAPSQEQRNALCAAAPDPYNKTCSGVTE